MNSVTLVILPHPLCMQDRASAPVPVGGTIAELLAGAGLDFLLDPDLAIALDLDGRPMLREVWDTVQPRAGQFVTVRALPGKGGRQGVQTVVMIAAMVIAAVATAGVGGAMAGAGYSAIAVGAAKAVVGTAIMVGGSYLAQAIAPIQPPKNQPGLESSNVYGGGAQKNRYMPGGRLPMVLGGGIRIWPDYLAKPYTSVSGNDSYLHMMVGMCGPATISDIRLGDTPIVNIPDVQIVSWPNSKASAPNLTGIIEAAAIKEEATSIPLVAGSASTTRTFRDIESFEYDVHFPVGLIGKTEGGNKREIGAYIITRYRKVGTDEWTDAPFVYSAIFFNPRDVYDFSTTKWTRCNYDYWKGPVTVQGKTTSPFFRTFQITLPERGDYEIQWTREWHPSEAVTGLYSQATLTSFRSRTFIGQSPVSWDKIPPTAGMAMKIKYTGGVSGIVDQLNCLATGHGYIPDVVNGGYTTGPIVYPPDACLWAMCGPHARRPLPFDRVDTETMDTWRDFCAANDLKIAAVVDYSPSLSDALRDVASVGRASPAMKDNLHSVVVDKQQDAPVQLINAANSAGLRVSKVMKSPPHGVRVKFRNAAADYEWDTRTVYADGYGESTATDIEDIELWGVTRSSQAWKAGRFWLADIKLRPEVMQTIMGVDNLRCTRGDWVQLAHDVILVGYCSGRIKGVTKDEDENVTAVTVDEECPMEEGGSYAVVFRLANGTVQTQPVQAVAGAQKTLAFVDPITIGKPIGGELFSFGESGKVTTDMIVTRIEPGADLLARVTMRAYAPAVHLADKGTIPDFETGITRPPSTSQTPAKPRILGVRSDEALLIQAGNSLRPRISVAFDLPQTITTDSGATALAPVVEYVQGQVRRSESGEAWGDAVVSPAAARHIIFEQGVEEGVSYDIRIRSVSSASIASGWSTVDGHEVVGKSTPPPDVPGLMREGNVLVWDYPDAPIDVAGFLLRFNWGEDRRLATAQLAHAGILSESRFDLTRLGVGTKTVFLTAVDVAGNESATPAIVIVDLGDQIVRNVILTEDYTAQGYPGTITGGVVSGSDLLASETTGFWPADDAKPVWPQSDSDPIWPEPRYSQLVYEFQYTPTPEVLDGDISLVLDLDGDGATVEYRTDSQAPIWPVSDLDPIWPDDDASPFWQPLPGWRPFPNRVGSLKLQTYYFRVTIPGGISRGCVCACAIHIDVPDVLETLEDVVISADGNTRLPITKDYRVIRSVMLTLQDDGGTATRVKVMDKSIIGPLVRGYDAAGSLAQALVDAQVQGY